MGLRYGGIEQDSRADEWDDGGNKNMERTALLVGWEEARATHFAGLPAYV